MSFTRSDKQKLQELINNIEHAYSSPAAFADGKSNKITLPSRLVRATADVVSQTYENGILESLTESEVELLLTSLLKAVGSMSESLTSVIRALPENVPTGIVEKLKQNSIELEALKKEREALFDSTQLVLESDQKLIAEKEELDRLRRQHEDLLAAKAELEKIDLDALRLEVNGLKTEIGPQRDEMQRLHSLAADRRAELDSIQAARAAAQEQLDRDVPQAKEMFTSLLEVSNNLVAALEPHLQKYESSIQKAADYLAGKAKEGVTLKRDLEARVAEVDMVEKELSSLSMALRKYAEANDFVSVNIPSVINLTKEKLSRVRELLGETDSELRTALERHRQANEVLQTSSFQTAT